MGFVIAHSDKYLFPSPPFFLTPCLRLSLSHFSLINQKTVLYLYKEFSNHVNEFI